MKKIILMAIVGITSSTIAFSQVRYGVQIGGNLGFAQTKSGSSDNNSNTPRLGLLAGFVADVPLGPVSFRPEINFIQKGYRNDDKTTASIESIDKVRLNYVEVPLNFTYNITTGSGKIYLGLGPNFALGLSGKDKEELRNSTSGTLTTTEATSDIKFSGNNNSSPNGTTYLKRFDFGADIIAGYQLAMGLTVNVGFTLGLSDISRNLAGIDDYTLKNYGADLKIGYMFGGSSMKSSKTKASTDTGTSANF